MKYLALGAAAVALLMLGYGFLLLGIYLRYIRKRRLWFLEHGNRNRNRNRKASIMSVAMVPLGSVSATATTTSAAVALPASAGELVEISNGGTVAVWAMLGTDSAVAAAVDSILIPAGRDRQFQLQSGQTHCALLSASSTALVGITRGRAPY